MESSLYREKLTINGIKMFPKIHLLKREFVKWTVVIMATVQKDHKFKHGTNTLASLYQKGNTENKKYCIVTGHEKK